MPGTEDNYSQIAYQNTHFHQARIILEIQPQRLSYHPEPTPIAAKTHTIWYIIALAYPRKPLDNQYIAKKATFTVKLYKVTLRQLPYLKT